jgi:hypothetical protein
MDPTVLGATVLPLEDPIDEVGEPSTTVRVRVRERAAAVPARFELPIDEAPLETTAIAEPRARVELTPTSSPAIERSQLATIDPFGD